ncbi:hypothetical protein D3C77_602380 [compost metagenome]
MGQRLAFILIAKIGMRVDMNDGQVRILLIHRLNDRPANEVLPAQADRELAVLQQTANIVADHIKTAGRVAERQQ